MLSVGVFYSHIPVLILLTLLLGLLLHDHSELVTLLFAQQSGLALELALLKDGTLERSYALLDRLVDNHLYELISLRVTILDHDLARFGPLLLRFLVRLLLPSLLGLVIGLVLRVLFVRLCGTSWASLPDLKKAIACFGGFIFDNDSSFLFLS